MEVREAGIIYAHIACRFRLSGNAMGPRSRNSRTQIQKQAWNRNQTRTRLHDAEFSVRQRIPVPLSYLLGY